MALPVSQGVDTVAELKFCPDCAGPLVRHVVAGALGNPGRFYGAAGRAGVEFSSESSVFFQVGQFFRAGTAPDNGVAMREAAEACDHIPMGDSVATKILNL